MIVGLVEWQQGHDGAAIDAFTQAVRLDPENALASYFLGQVLVSDGRLAEAIPALDRASRGTLSRVDQMEAGMFLGRVLIRAREPEQALEVWTRLEQQFPEDVRLQEQIVATLLEEGVWESVLPRLERLTRITSDATRRTMLRVDSADVKLQLGRTEEGLAELERVLHETNPDHWQARDIRRRIEQTFLRPGNHAGLIRYYEDWIRKWPEDLAAWTRQAELLHQVGRSAEARKRLEQGLERAPAHRPMRLALIHLLVEESQFEEAARHYAELDRQDPNNPDTLRDWGRTVMKTAATTGHADGVLYRWALNIDLARRQKAAAAIWSRLLAARPDDPQAVIQVAELYREAGLKEDAVTLYRKAIELAPEQGHYREYLGDLLRSLGRHDEALRVWRAMAEGTNRSAGSLARLSDLLVQQEQPAEALQALVEACALDPRALNLHFKRIDLLSRWGRHREALEHLSVARLLSETDEEQEACLRRELVELEHLEELRPRIRMMQQQMAERPDSGGWYWLARALEVDQQPTEAMHAIDQARGLAPDSLPILEWSAQLHESHRNFGVAVALYRELVAKAPKSRILAWQRIVALEERQGHATESLAAARELLDAAPENPDICEFVADVCLRQGRHDEGIQILQRALRRTPDNRRMLTRLAEVLLDRDRTAEGLELLWTALDRAGSLEEQRVIVRQLTVATLKTGSPNSLYIRLQREFRKPGRHREMMFLLAEAHEAAGDLATAQSRLESLLTADTTDPALLNQLRGLAERQGHFTQAVRYQHRLWELTRSRQDRLRLQRLVIEMDAPDVAMDLLADTFTDELSADVLQLIDALLQRSRVEEARSRLGRLMTKHPDNWEVVYRDAVSRARTDPEVALRRFEDLLALPCSDDEPSLLGGARRNRLSVARFPWVERLAELSLAQQSTRPAKLPKPPRVATARRLPPAWSPADFGMARMGALSWIHALSPDRSQALLQEDAAGEGAPRSGLRPVDRLVLEAIRGNADGRVAAARALMTSAPEEFEFQLLYFLSITETPVPGARSALSWRQIDELITIFQKASQRDDLVPYNVHLLRLLSTELSLARREDEAGRILHKAVEGVRTQQEASMILLQLRILMEPATLSLLLKRLHEFQRESPSTASAVVAVPGSVRLSALAGSTFQKTDDPDMVLELWQRLLAIQGASPLVQPVRRSNPAQASPAGASPLELILAPEDLVLLNRVKAVFDSAGRPAELIEAFEASLRAASAPQERVLWHHTLAYVLWNSGQQERTIEHLEQACRALPDHAPLALNLARLYRNTNQTERAYELLQSVEPDSPSLRYAHSRLRLSLERALNRDEAARETARQIAQGPVPAEDLLDLARHLRELGLSEQMEHVLMQLKATSVESLMLLMHAQEEIGKRDLAARTANVLLAQLDKATPLAGLPVETQAVFEEMRQQCYAVLRQSGELPQMIAAAEKLLETDPDSLDTIQLLTGYHTASGNTARLEVLLPRMHDLEIERLRRQPDKPASRYSLARKFAEAGRPEEAKRELAVLFNKDPNFLATQGRALLTRSAEDPAIPPLIPLIVDQEWFRLPRTSVLGAVLLELLHHRNPTAATLAQEVFQRAWHDETTDRLSLLQQLNAEVWWPVANTQYPLYRIFIPRNDAEAAAGWSIYGRTMRAGQATLLSRFLESADLQTLDAFAGDVQNGLTRFPDWAAGRALLAVINLRRERVPLAIEALNDQRDALEVAAKVHPAATLELAGLALRHPEGLELGTRITLWSVRNRQAPTAAALARLVDAWSREGREEALPAALLRAVPFPVPPVESMPLSAEDHLQTLAIARALSAAGASWDALALQALAVRGAAGTDKESYARRNDAEAEQTQILRTITAETALAAFNRLQSDSLRLTIPIEISASRPAGILVNRLNPVLGLLARNTSGPGEVQRALDRIGALQPDNVVPRILSVQIALARRDTEPTAALIEPLSRFLAKQSGPLPASEEVALWFVARECLAIPGLADEGAVLGQRALDASRRLDQETQQAILKEWLILEPSDSRRRLSLQQESNRLNTPTDQ